MIIAAAAAIFVWGMAAGMWLAISQAARNDRRTKR